MLVIFLFGFEALFTSSCSHCCCLRSAYLLAVSGDCVLRDGWRFDVQFDHFTLC